MDTDATPAPRRRRRSTRPAGAPPAAERMDAAPAVSDTAPARPEAAPSQAASAKKPRTKPRTRSATRTEPAVEPAMTKPTVTKPAVTRPEPVRQPRSGGQRGRDNERGWRELAGNAPSQVSISAALRARDLGRPRPEQLAAAERELPIVRRQWQPEA